MWTCWIWIYVLHVNAIGWAGGVHFLQSWRKIVYFLSCGPNVPKPVLKDRSLLTPQQHNVTSLHTFRISHCTNIILLAICLFLSCLDFHIWNTDYNIVIVLHFEGSWKIFVVILTLSLLFLCMDELDTGTWHLLRSSFGKLRSLNMGMGIMDIFLRISL